MSDLDETLKRMRVLANEPYRYSGEPAWCDICESYGCKSPYGPNFSPYSTPPLSYLLERSEEGYSPDGGEPRE